MITFQEEPWADVREEIVTGLGPGHYSEVYGDNDYAPIVLEYDAMAHLGMLAVLTARREGELVGYILIFVRPHMHQSRVLWGFFDMYYLRHSARAPGVAGRMIKAAEAMLKTRGVKKLYAAEKVGGGLFRNCGWHEAIERGWRKDL